MSKERMSFESFNDCDDAVMATHAQVISLGNIVSQDHSRTLANS
jgi:hypothetical protein